MNWSLVRIVDAKPQPWKNAGGVTRELLALPAGDDWTVRISVAEVERDGPFSSFPGVVRWFAVLAGAGLKLRVGDVEHRLTTLSPPLAFDGAAEASCSLLDGATQDLNLMLRGRAAKVTRIEHRAHARCTARSLFAVYAKAPASVSVDSSGIDVPADTLAWRTFDEDASITVEGEGVVWMEIAP